MALVLRLFRSGQVPQSGSAPQGRANRALNVSEVRQGLVSLRSTPLQMNVDLTGVCNIHPPCVFCSGKNVGYNYRPLHASELDRHSSYLSRCECINDDSFGEPLSHPQILDVARRCISNGQRFNFVSNGLLLTRDKAQALADLGPDLGMHVSFNAATAETFYKLTGMPFGLLVDNVRSFVEFYRAGHAGAAPRDLTLTFIVMRVNLHEVSGFVRLAGELGARALLASLHDRPSKPLGHFGYDFVYEREMLSLDELERAGREATSLGACLGVEVLLQWDASADTAIQGFAEPGVDIPCLIPWRFLHVQQHSQKVYACPYHKRPMGDLSEHSIEEIWNGPIARDLRAALAGGRIPQFCWNNSAACPLIFRARQKGLTDPLASDITMGENDHVHLVEGWHSLEEIPEHARWTSERAAFRIADRDGTILGVRCQSFKPGLEREPARGYVEIGGTAVARFELARPGWHDLRFALPAPRFESERENAELAVAIVVENPWVPSETLRTSVLEAVIGSPRVVAGSRDTRLLGIVVQRIWIE